LSLHEDIPTIVNKVFVNKPLDLKGGNLDWPGPPRYCGLPMVNLGRPPLPWDLIVDHLTIMNMLRL
jgi:hypothetical protein